MFLRVPARSDAPDGAAARTGGRGGDLHEGRGRLARLPAYFNHVGFDDFARGFRLLVVDEERERFETGMESRASA
jgi:hypothetical protein